MPAKRSTKRRSSALCNEGPAKRLQTTRSRTSKVSSYFATLEENLLDQVKRHTSEKPLTKSWSNYVGLDEVQRYVAAGHLKQAVTLKCFRAIMACDMYPYQRRGLLVRGKNSATAKYFRDTAFALRGVISTIFIYQATFPPIGTAR